MTALALLDILSLSISAIIGGALVLIVFGSGPRRLLNIVFSLFALSLAATAFCDLLRYVTLGFQVGQPLLLTRLSYLFQQAMQPLLLWFTALYLQRRSRWTDGAVGVGLALLVIQGLLLPTGQLIYDPRFNAYGISSASLEVLGLGFVLFYTLYNVWSLILFWQERRQTRGLLLAAGVLILEVGYALEFSLRLPFPLSSITTALGVLVLGYGVIRRQIFNPLRDLTERLQAEIAERQRAEASVRAERNTLRTLIDNLPDVVYVKDTQSRFVLNNAAHLRSLGVQRQEEVVGKTDLDFFPRELASQYHADEQAIIQSGQPLINHEELVEDQTTRETAWFLTTKVPLRDDQGQITGLVGIGRDITAQKQAEAERERLQQQIIEAQRQAIRDLSSPVIPIMERVIVMPLMGDIDPMRAKEITRTLLAGIGRHRAKVVILDITGVAHMDTGVANRLNQTVQAARLKGARVILTGISDAVAETMVDLGIDWSSIETLTDLQTGLRVALDGLGSGWWNSPTHAYSPPPGLRADPPAGPGQRRPVRHRRRLAGRG